MHNNCWLRAIHSMLLPIGRFLYVARVNVAAATSAGGYYVAKARWPMIPTVSQCNTCNTSNSMDLCSVRDASHTRSKSQTDENITEVCL